MCSSTISTEPPMAVETQIRPSATVSSQRRRIKRCATPIYAITNIGMTSRLIYWKIFSCRSASPGWTRRFSSLSPRVWMIAWRKFGKGKCTSSQLSQSRSDFRFFPRSMSDRPVQSNRPPAIIPTAMCSYCLRRRWDSLATARTHSSGCCMCPRSSRR